MSQICRVQMAGQTSTGNSLQDVQTPQDMVKVFAETQRNMMELNR